MSRPEYESSLDGEAPPETLPLHLQAMWWLANNNWQRAHDLIDQAPGRECAWVHAHLHRIEGDEFNANYWYRRAGRDAPDQGLSREKEEILDDFLD